MSSDIWREALYPLGFLASLAFGGRFLLQWIASEIKKESVVPKAFWVLSLMGNLSLLLHSFIQVQFHVLLVQSCNAVISWRNLNLMQPSSRHVSFKRTLAILIGTVLTTSFLFWLQIDHTDTLFRTPVTPWHRNAEREIALPWHVLGFVGLMLFNSRFWVQWWYSEKKDGSYLGASFWWLSLVGDSLCLLYFLRLGDPVNLVGPMFGLIPYIRNLMLLKKTKPLGESQPTDLFIFAGEPSGDLHGSHVLQQLRNHSPNLRISGVGGPAMRAQGMGCYLQMEDFEVMGFTDVLRSLPKLWCQFYRVRDEILKTQPSLVFLIDYPGFNLRLAKSLRKKGYQGKIIHYIAPSVWAHGKKRIETMAKSLDALLTIFPFEKKYFSHTPLQVDYVGNPLHEYIENYAYDFHWLQKIGLEKQARLVTLFPGSRQGEIARNLPAMLEASKKLKQEYPEIVFAISCANDLIKGEISKLVQESTLRDVQLVPKSFAYEMMKNSRLALAKSGTVTLELALHECPTVVVYQLTPLNRFIAKHILRLKLPYYCMVNILKAKKVFPEFIEHGFSADNIYLAAKQLYNSTDRREACVADCREVKALLNEKKASLAAAQKIMELLPCRN